MDEHEGKTIIELRMNDGTVRRFHGHPAETAVAHHLGRGLVRLMVVRQVSECKKPGPEALSDHGPVLAAMVDAAVDRAVGRSTTALNIGIAGVEACIAAVESVARSNNELAFQSIDDLESRVAALEVLSAQVPHRKVLAAFPIEGREVRIELHERAHG